MIHFSRNLLIWLFLGTLAFAGSLDSPQGEPPNGLHIEGAAKGTKLNGSLFTELVACTPGGPGENLCDARIVLRLRKGTTTDVEMFYGEVLDVNINIPSEAQEDIIAVMGPQIIERFFPGNSSLEIKLRSVTEYGFLPGSVATGGSQFILTDLQLAVN